jgi:hypothetical protein
MCNTNYNKPEQILQEAGSTVAHTIDMERLSRLIFA